MTINYFFLQELIDSKEAKESLNLSQDEKLQVCVDLAEALYHLHGYSTTYDKFEVRFTQRDFFAYISYTVCFTDLGKLNLLLWFDFKVEPVFGYCLCGIRKTLAILSGQN